jgi:hypothetical protein
MYCETSKFFRLLNVIKKQRLKKLQIRGKSHICRDDNICIQVYLRSKQQVNVSSQCTS